MSTSPLSIQASISSPRVGAHVRLEAQRELTGEDRVQQPAERGVLRRVGVERAELDRRRDRRGAGGGERVRVLEDRSGRRRSG